MDGEAVRDESLSQYDSVRSVKEVFAEKIILI